MLSYILSPLKSLFTSSKATCKVCRGMVRSNLLVKLTNFPAKLVLESPFPSELECSERVDPNLRRCCRLVSYRRVKVETLHAFSALQRIGLSQ
jgi:hypothetical protein